MTFLKMLLIKSHSHVTICGCTRSPNVFRFKAFLQNVKVKNFTVCPNNPAKIYGRVKLSNVAKAFLQNIEVKNVYLRNT